VRAEAGPLSDAVTDKIYYDTLHFSACIFHRFCLLRIVSTLIFSYAITFLSAEKLLIKWTDYSLSVFSNM